MKVGDLVTFSTYGLNLSALRWAQTPRPQPDYKSLVGIIYKITPKDSAPYRPEARYYVKWSLEGVPEGRDRWRASSYFHRKDLKKARLKKKS